MLIEFELYFICSNENLCFRKTNRTSESERMLKRCLRLEPTFTPAYIELARLGGPNNPSVGPLLVKVASLNPTDPYYITLYAHWLLNKGNIIIRNFVPLLLHF